jgi:hypothetical protein
LKVKGQVKLDGKIYETKNEASYKRSYLPLQTGSLKGRVNSIIKEVEFEVKISNIAPAGSAISFHHFTVYRNFIIPSVSNRMTITDGCSHFLFRLFLECLLHHCISSYTFVLSNFFYIIILI